jgi:hypothetical protein
LSNKKHFLALSIKFQFLPKNANLSSYFTQILVFLLQEGYFSDAELKKMAQVYLSPKEEEKMMTNTQIWRQEGIAIGEQRGIEIHSIVQLLDSTRPINIPTAQ